MDYKQSGVDIKAADNFIASLKTAIKISDRNVIQGIGDFGAVYRLGDQYLVAGADGVGTKLKIAFLMDKHDTVGIDLVAMNVNDILTKGAKPLFFLDYIATGKVEPVVLEKVAQGIYRGCEEAGCSLIGGETAEMPDFYHPGEYDLSGFSVGVVKPEYFNHLNGSEVKAGDSIIGIPSSGTHSNGYSLLRSVFFKNLKMKVSDYIPELRKILGEELITPTRIYVKTVLNILENCGSHILGMAHITGGGFTNISRINPGVGYVINKLLPIPPIFSYVQKQGSIDDAEMFRTFNMGCGYVLITDKPDDILPHCGPGADVIGTVQQKPGVFISDKNIALS